MKRWLLTSLVATLLTFVSRLAHGQEFERSCHDQQLQKLDKQLSALSDTERARHPELAEQATQSRKIIVKGTELSNNLKDAWKTFAERRANDPAMQQARRQLENIAKNVDQTNVESVRHFEKQRESYNEMVQTKVVREGLSEPVIDQANSAVNKYQRYADVKEAEFLEKRLIAGPGAAESSKVTDHVVETAAVSLRISPANQALIRSNGIALSQAKAADALAAYTVADTISREGSLPDHLEGAVKQAMIPFDTAAKVLPTIAGDALVGQMGLTHLGKWGGNTGAVDTRKRMGPKTREEASATAAMVLTKLNHVENFSATFKQNIRKEIVVPSPNLPPPKDPESVKTLITGVTKALKKTLEEEAGKLPVFTLP